LPGIQRGVEAKIAGAVVGQHRHRAGTAAIVIDGDQILAAVTIDIC
jgi:hypothetical protein